MIWERIGVGTVIVVGVGFSVRSAREVMRYGGVVVRVSKFAGG